MFETNTSDFGLVRLFYKITILKTCDYFIYDRNEKKSKNDNIYFYFDIRRKLSVIRCYT